MADRISMETRNVLDVAARVLLRCFVLCMAILLVWALSYLALGDLAHRIHSTMFDLTVHEFMLINYCGMGLLKILVFVLFLCPYVAIRLVLRKADAPDSAK